MDRIFRSLIICFALALPCAARADIGIVLNSSVGSRAGWFTSSGHSSVYLSRICAETPLKARMCGPGEIGSVLSAYSNFHEARPYEWNLIPVSVFLYGVDDPADRPLYGTQELLSALRERYRVEHLGELCTTQDCRENPDANWIDTVGETFVRTVYIFEIKTTEAQDLAFIERLNNRANANHYSSLDWNCADFAKDVINSYFPHAVRADRWNDFGMTGPKAIARSLTHYADHHQHAAGLRITRFEQLPSNIARSDPARDATEAMFAEKKFMVPLLFRPEELAFFSASYFLTARFSAERAVRRHEADAELSALQDVAANQPAVAQARDLQSYGWNRFETDFAALEAEARAMGIIRNDGDVARTITDLDKTAAPFVDSTGRPWLNMRPAQANLADFDVGTVVGITPATVEKSRDRQAAALAYKLQLARVRFYLHSSGMNREALPEFKQDWALLQATRKTYLAEEYSAPEVVTAQNRGAAMSSPAAESQPRGQ
jgi:hypothetical protein